MVPLGIDCWNRMSRSPFFGNKLSETFSVLTGGMGLLCMTLPKGDLAALLILEVILEGNMQTNTHWLLGIHRPFFLLTPLNIGLGCRKSGT